MSLIKKLPEVKGRIRENADLKKTNWFQVGGAAETLFKPSNLEDLQNFLKYKPECEITVLGVGSNIVVRDGGIDGVVIKLGREFASITHEGEKVTCGAAALDGNVAQYSQINSLAGLEFLSGIPGTIGGALAMNGGAYGTEISDILVSAQAVDMQGSLLNFVPDDLQYSYRKCEALAQRKMIFTQAILQAQNGEGEEIAARISQIKSERELSQPVHSRTGGSTFKNPEGAKAWKLIDDAGCRGFKIGGAMMSELHCNFVINTGTASAADIENLVHEVQARVEKNSGISLETEIKFLGKKS